MTVQIQENQYVIFPGITANDFQEWWQNRSTADLNYPQISKYGGNFDQLEADCLMSLTDGIPMGKYAEYHAIYVRVENDFKAR
jgi:hypothetical protein